MRVLAEDYKVARPRGGRGVKHDGLCGRVNTSPLAAVRVFGLSNGQGVIAVRGKIGQLHASRAGV